MYSIRQATRNISDARLRVRVLPHPRVDKQKRKSHENIFEHIYGLASRTGLSMNGPVYHLHARYPFAGLSELN